MNEVHSIQEKIATIPNIVYKTVDSIQLKLDVYAPVQKLGEEPWEVFSDEAKPTLIYFHGGGWVEGDRTSRFLGLLPYLEKGWCVVNVDYRLLDQTNLIGCLEDCLDAIKWVDENSNLYKFDMDRMYLSGESAGGHLALMAGLFPSNPKIRTIIKSEPYDVKGIINWYGITDVNDAVAFWNDDEYTKTILADWQGNTTEYFQMNSPINAITQDSPPIISIHGNADINVDISQAIILHKRLDEENVRNKLITIPGKKHGNFTSQELTDAYESIWTFTESN